MDWDAIIPGDLVHVIGHEQPGKVIASFGPIMRITFPDVGVVDVQGTDVRKVKGDLYHL